MTEIAVRTDDSKQGGEPLTPKGHQGVMRKSREGQEGVNKPLLPRMAGIEEASPAGTPANPSFELRWELLTRLTRRRH